MNFDDIKAFQLRNAGRVEVFVFVWQQTLWTDGLEYYHVLQQRAPSGTGVVRHTVLLLLRSGHYSLIHNFQALAGRQGLTLGATLARFTARACGLSLEVTDLRVKPPSRECPL